jgi:ElaB/YqjD/DUF883 family membrane-anchored ribosome-binding protein
MTDTNQEKQAQQDTARVKKDLNTMLTNRVSQITDEIEKLTVEAKDTMVDAAESVKKDIGVRLGQYNSKAQEVVEMVPGGFVEKATRYPWVALSLAVIVGFILGNLFKPTRQIYK